MCVLLCFVMLYNEVNVDGQSSHLNGLSPVWLLKCMTKDDFLRNVFEQVSHLRGVSLALVLWCCFKSDLLRDVDRQASAVSNFCSVCAISTSMGTKYDFPLEFMSQLLSKYM